MKLNIKEEQHREDTCCPIVELRQYTLHPGKRDMLIELFEREFIESQEAVGMKVIGQFRDLDDPNRFVWLRGFDDMSLRAQGLSAFYGGPVWKKHRDAANATMIDSDNVLLLHPASRASGFALADSERPPLNSTKIPDGLIVATTYYLNSPNNSFVDFFERTLIPLFTDFGASIIAYFETENSANNFPALPVREGIQVFIWFALFQDQADYERYTAAVSGSMAWRSKVSNALARRIKGKSEVLRLSPTARSLLHG